MCVRCRRETADDAAALVELVRKGRQLRLEIDEPLPGRPAVSVSGPGLGQLFEATGDDIPY